MFASLSARPSSTQPDRRDDLARRTIAALERVEVDEGFLHRVEGTVRVRQPLDGGHRFTVGHHSERQTGKHALAVNEHGAGAALAVVAPLLGSGETDVLAQRVEKRYPRIKRQTMGLTVDKKSRRAGRPLAGGSIGVLGCGCFRRQGKRRGRSPRAQKRSPAEVGMHDDSLAGIAGMSASCDNPACGSFVPTRERPVAQM